MKRYACTHPLSRVYVTADSFGDRLPDNWETIAAAMNGRIEKIIAAEHITDECDYPDYLQLQSITRQADELWDAMISGQLPDIVPVYSGQRL